MSVVEPDRWRIGDSLRWFRERKGWNQTELAEAAGLSLKTVSRIENYGNFERTTLEALADALGEPLADLERFQPGALAVELSRAGLMSVVHVAGHGTYTAGEVERPNTDIPVITEAQAGEGRIVYDDPASLEVYAERRVPRPEGVTDARAFAVMVRGDSMVPVFKPGRYVVVSPNVAVAQGDEVFVALTSGERLIKVVYRANGGFVLESANPTYPPRFVKAEDVQVMYPVIWAKRREG